MRRVAVGLWAVLLLACAPEDTRASKACAASGTAGECKACCFGQGDRNYMFRTSGTTKRCMCQFSR